MPRSGAKLTTNRGDNDSNNESNHRLRSRSKSMERSVGRNAKQSKRKSDVASSDESIMPAKVPKVTEKTKTNNNACKGSNKAKSHSQRNTRKAIAAKSAKGADSNTEELESFNANGTEMAVFIDGQNLIEMKVPETEAKDYPSEDGQSESESEDREIDLSSQRSRSCNNNASAVEPTEEEDSHPSGSEYESESPVQDLINTSTQSSELYGGENDRRSMEQKLDKLTDTLSAMQSMMVKKGFFDNSDNSNDEPEGTTNHRRAKKKKRKQDDSELPLVTQSETTIYKNAVEQVDEINDVVQFRNRTSTLSEEDNVNTNDELINEPNLITGHDRHNSSSSRERERGKTPTRAEQTIIDKENPVLDFSTEFMHSAMVDEAYLTVGRHVEEGLRQKIWNNEFIDFARLLPRDRVVREEDHRLEFVFKGGASYLVPATDQDNSMITNYNKWEQAFRIFSNIYTQKFPQKAAELIQYNHIIHTASMTFVWDNVYLYDKEFRIHMSKFPGRSWAIILQQAWILHLKERLRHDGTNDYRGFKAKVREPCHRFNKGKCTNGNNCKYEHRCTIPACGKYGHGVHI